MYQAGKQWNNRGNKNEIRNKNVGISFYIQEKLTKVTAVIIVRLQLYVLQIVSLITSYSMADPGGGEFGGLDPPIRPDAYNFEAEIRTSTGSYITF